jgi:hypothetical protein
LALKKDENTEGGKIFLPKSLKYYSIVKKIKIIMKFLSLEPFVPSGSNFEGSKIFFQELGFTVKWADSDYVGFESDGCKFVLQKFENKEFAQNYMVTVRINNAKEFWTFVTEKQLPEKFGVRISPPTQQPYGIEVNIIDLAGVCWHFVE